MGGSCVESSQSLDTLLGPSWLSGLWLLIGIAFASCQVKWVLDL